jgi:RNA polymerase sigma-70 factor (ECF subfamily)
MPAGYEHLTDQELLQRFHADGQTEWLGILLKRYTLMLFGVGMKYLRDEEEAKDVVQAVFLKALTELPKYKVDYIKSWLYMIARNHCLMKLRNKNTTLSFEEREMEWVDDIPDTRASNQEALLLSMESALQELQPAQRTCVTLFYLEKKSYHQIASQTGFTLLQVKSYIQNGKRNLKIQLQKHIEHD